jgi:hypothetical protein
LVAWDRDTAKTILKCLAGTKIAIRGGAAYYATTDVPVAFDGWSATPVRGEQATAFAERSRGVAASKVQEHQGSPTNPVLFAFDFSEPQAAA